MNNKRLLLIILSLFPSISMASAQAENWLDLTNHWVGFSALAIFIIAYMFVMAEEFIHLRKSKPVVLAAGIIWALIAY
ncbi:Na+/H+ antiporter NhaD type, partial [hydrothermal vent metagenome]